MAVVVDTRSGAKYSSVDDIRAHLAEVGVDYERWTATRDLAHGAAADDVLEAYRDDVERLKAAGGYVTADVISVTPETAGLEEMLARFASEHTHDDDEVRFVVSGRGLFFVRSGDGGVLSIEVEAGDLIRLPAGIRHWFTLCAERSIRAIRLFKDPAGWVPRYTESGVDRLHLPVCLGPSFVTADRSGSA